MTELYTTLDIESYQIRLLRILPGPPGSVIRSELQRHALFNVPRYAALSYCWGDETDRQTILINNVPINITTTLEEALQHLRTMNVELVWADAICINQEDVTERSLQVRNMKHIYAKAETVYAWLGSSTEAASGLRYLRDMSENRAGLPDTSHIQNCDENGNLLVPDPSCELESNVNDPTALIECPYWKRRWVIQEVTVASTARVLCANEELELDEMIEMINRCAQSTNWTSTSYPYIQQITAFRKAYQDGRPLGLCNSLLLTQNSLSKDCRDKIYALLGICADATELVPIPSYQQSPTDVAVNLTRELLRQNSCLDLIIIKDKSQTDALPSWSPDWLALHLPSSIAQTACDKGYLSRSSCHRILKGSISELLAHGISLGRVAAISSIISTPLPALEIPNHGVKQLRQNRGPIRYGRDTTSAILMCLLSTDDRPRALRQESDSTRLYSMLQAVNEPSTLSTTKLLDIEPGQTEHIWTQWVMQNSEMQIEGKPLLSWLEQSWPLYWWVRFVTSPFGVLFRSLGFSHIKLPLFVLNFIIVPDIINTSFLILQFLAVLPLYLALVIVSFCVGSAVPVSKVETSSKPPSIAPNSSRRLVLTENGVLGMADSDVQEGDQICFIAGCTKAVVLRPAGRGDEERHTVVGSSFVCLSRDHAKRYKTFLAPFTETDRAQKSEEYNVLMEKYKMYEEWQAFTLV